MILGGMEEAVWALGRIAAAVGPQSVFDPSGPQAARVARLGWFLFITGGVIYLLVMIALAVAVRLGRKRHSREGREPLARGGPHPAPEPGRERRLARAVGTGVGATAIVLLAVIGTSYFTGKVNATLPTDDPLVIKVTGQQWWWKVEYQNPVSSRILTTANELHIPVGRVVQLQLTSADVIHSFWAPNLAGKRDAIPGQTSMVWFVADRPGEWRGQCAEFCGYQHAHMAFSVVAEDEAQFAAWYENGLRDARAPETPVEQRGQQVFLTTSCVLCHTIAGTLAGGRLGPDLTHVGSRTTLGAATLENTKGHLAGWVSDPQEIKPGIRMPPNPMPPEDLEALVVYLESLK